MKKLYALLCRIEELIVQLFLFLIMFLVFISAIFRTFKHPLNWAIDVSLLLFAWLVFLGADSALRNTDLVNVDLIIRKLSKKGQTIIYLIWNTVILIFLAGLLTYGTKLSIESATRLFQTLEISYSWATISIPIGSLLMIVNTIIKMFKLCKIILKSEEGI